MPGSADPCTAARLCSPVQWRFGVSKPALSFLTQYKELQTSTLKRFISFGNRFLTSPECCVFSTVTSSCMVNTLGSPWGLLELLRLAFKVCSSFINKFSMKVTAVPLTGCCEADCVVRISQIVLFSSVHFLLLQMNAGWWQEQRSQGIQS